MIRYTARLTPPVVLVFDPVDAFAAKLGYRGEKPRPLGAVRFDLTHRWSGTEWVPFPAELGTVENPSGFHLFYGRRRGPRGRVTMPPGEYAVRVTATHYQAKVVRAQVTTPDRPIRVSVELQPGFAYPFPTGRTAGGLPGPTLLRGSLRRANGELIAGATVVADWAGGPIGSGRETYLTDTTGQWVIPLPDLPQPAADPPPDAPPPQPVVVQAQIDGLWIVLRNAPVTLGTTTVVGQGGLSGRAVRRAGGPLAGAVVTAEPVGAAPYPGRSVSGPDGRWEYYLPPDVRTATDVVVTAEADGARVSAAPVTVRPGRYRTIPNLEFDR